MVEFAVVDKEMANGVIAGTYYGSAVRILARSPTHVLFSAHGVQLWNRDKRGGFRDLACLTRNRPSKFAYKAISHRIDSEFGEGTTDRLIQANGHSQTILVDGGGESMSLPRAQFIVKVTAEHRNISPDWRADLTGRVKTCKQCGENLRPSTDRFDLGYKIQPDHPTTLAECQKLTNHAVIAVHGFDTRYRDRWAYVKSFEIWDGESYVDEDFCDNKCAASYGRRAAREHLPLEPGVLPPQQAHRVPNTRHLYPEEIRTLWVGDKEFEI